jgi:TATA-box binding protein (TBP) (component of TFIID and TFIIIB)
MCRAFIFPLTIRNTVHTAVIQHRFCLESTATALKGRYGSAMFPAASFRFLDPFVTLSVFEEGKVVVTGTDDFLEALRAIHLLCRLHETFPGLRYWPGEDDNIAYDAKTIVLILFTSGAVVIAGAKSKADMKRTLDGAVPKIAPYRV